MVHEHSILMLSAVAVVAAFVPIVVVVRWLETRGYVRDTDGRIAFRSYGAVIAGAFSAGSAAIHLSVIGDHAAQSTSAGDPLLFLCSVGVATTHVTTMDATVAEFIPRGAATLLVAPLQLAWVVPRLWRKIRVAFVGLVVAVCSLLLGVSQIVLSPSIQSTSPSPAAFAEVTSVSLIGEGLLLIAVAIMVSGRPRPFIERLEARRADAYVAIGLAFAAVVIFTAVAIGAYHIPH